MASVELQSITKRFGAVEVHMIGPLQTNKAKVAVELFDTIHSLDRPSLADKLASLAQTRGASPDLFVQVNTGAEPQKAGILPEALDAFIADCRRRDLPLRGLMCIPPEAEDATPHFQTLADMAARRLADLSSASFQFTPTGPGALAPVPATRQAPLAPIALARPQPPARPPRLRACRRSPRRSSSPSFSGRGEAFMLHCSIGPFAEPLPQGSLVGISEPAPAMITLAGSVLEADVKRATGAQRAPQPVKGGWYRGQRYVEQTCAAPDAIKRFGFVDIVEAPDTYLEPTVGAGKTRQLWGRVKGRDLEASLGKGPGITS